MALPTRETERFSSFLSLPDNSPLFLSLSAHPLPELSVGDNARQFLRRLLPRRRTMNLRTAPLLLPVFLPLFFSFFFFFFIFPLLRPRGRDPLSLLLSARRLPRPASRGFSFSCLEPGRGLLSVRAQPLAYNETENLRGTRGMQRMITYIETKNRPARRSAALFLSLSVVLSSSSPPRPKTRGHLAKRAIAARIKRSGIVTKRFVSAGRML